jgi:hypothetical protein
LREGRRGAEHRHHAGRDDEPASAAAKRARAHEVGTPAHRNADRRTCDRDVVNARTICVELPRFHVEPPILATLPSLPSQQE